MRTRARFLLAALATLPALAACADTPTGSEGAPAFAATIRGSVQDEYLGAGFFHRVEPLAGAPSRGLFSIHSHDGAGRQSFLLFREGDVRPERGRYPLASSAAGPVRFGAVYHRVSPDRVEGFTAISGELEVTVSREDRIEGSFRFTGVRNCAGTPARVDCTPPPDLTQPRVEVTGTFVAVRGGPLQAVAR
jgi:hypothetical protein